MHTCFGVCTPVQIHSCAYGGVHACTVIRDTCAHLYYWCAHLCGHVCTPVHTTGRNFEEKYARRARQWCAHLFGINRCSSVYVTTPEKSFKHYNVNAKCYNRVPVVIFDNDVVIFCHLGKVAQILQHVARKGQIIQQVRCNILQ